MAHTVQTKTGKTLITAIVSLAALSVALTGCISLFPKSKPAGLYRFGHAAAESSRPSSDKTFGVYKTPTVFTRAAMSDRLLSVTDGITERKDAVGRLLDDDDGLARVLARCGGLNAGAVAARIQRAAEDFGAGPRIDDMALLVLRAL